MIVVYRSDTSLLLFTARTATPPENYVSREFDRSNRDHLGYRDQRRIEGSYRDDPLLEHDEEAASVERGGRDTIQQADRGPIVQPSGLQAHTDEL